MSIKIKVAASEVRAGDMLLGLNHGYVFEEPVNDPEVTLPGDGRFGYGVPSGYVLISFHDAQGEENYLVITDEHPLEVQREGEADEEEDE